MNQPRAILFDNDGVLVHTEQQLFNCNMQAAQDLDIPYTREDFIHHTFIEGWGSDGWLQHKGYSQEMRVSFKARRVALVSECTYPDLVVPTTVEILHTLASTHSLAVATNSTKEFLRGIYTNTIPLDIFKAIVTREDYENPKPAPDAYVAALQKLGVTNNEAVVVEDSPRGIRAAQTAGIPVIAIINPAFPELDQSAAEYQITTLEELPRLLERL